LEWFKLHFASGYAFLSRAMILRVRSFSGLLANLETSLLLIVRIAF
jgi:hypothetical protein